MSFKYRQVSRLTFRKDTRKKVLEATEAAEVKKNETGELELHGRTYFAWTTAVPGVPLKSGG